MAKFEGDRSRELGERVAKKRNITVTGKIYRRHPVLPYWRPNKKSVDVNYSCVDGSCTPAPCYALSARIVNYASEPDARFSNSS